MYLLLRLARGKAKVKCTLTKNPGDCTLEIKAQVTILSEFAEPSKHTSLVAGFKIFVQKCSRGLHLNSCVPGGMCPVRLPNQGRAVPKISSRTGRFLDPWHPKPYQTWVPPQHLPPFIYSPR